MRSGFTQKMLLAIVPRLAAGLVRVLGMTLRYEDVLTPGAIQGHLVPGPCVFAFWHRSLLASAHHFRNYDIAILISRSFDGELIARTVEQLGFTAVRGSSSRGGAIGLKQMAEAYAAKHRCAITADGPRGPAMVAKPGTAQLARLVGAEWVGVFYVLPLKAWMLKTWDSFLIPKPFSRVLVTWPPTVNVSEVGQEEGALEQAIQNALNEAVRMANAAAQA